VLGEPGVDYPEDKTVVDVVATSRSDVLMSFVEEVRDSELIISLPKDRLQRPVRLDTGERLEIIWRGPEELRALPAELADVDKEAEHRWRLRVVGPAGRGQRRGAVRAPMIVPVQIQRDSDSFLGNTVDLSETGLRCIVDLATEDKAARTAEAPVSANAETGGPKTAAAGPGRLDVGQVVAVTTGWDGETVSVRGEVVRRHHREDALQEVSVRFIAPPEYVEDAIRRRVFTSLRDMRVRGLI
jgi:hypothetical protein